MNITFTFNTRSSQELASQVAHACKAYFSVSRQKKRSLNNRIVLVNQISSQFNVNFETMWRVLYDGGYE
jgi:hypothetical protein